MGSPAGSPTTSLPSAAAAGASLGAPLLASPAPSSAGQAPLSPDAAPFFPGGRSKALRWSEDFLGHDDLSRQSSYRDVLRVEPSVESSPVGELSLRQAAETVVGRGAVVGRAGHREALSELFPSLNPAAGDASLSSRRGCDRLFGCFSCERSTLYSGVVTVNHRVFISSS